MCVLLCVGVHACMCVHMCVWVCVCACTHVCLCAHMYACSVCGVGVWENGQHKKHAAIARCCTAGNAAAALHPGRLYAGVRATLSTAISLTVLCPLFCGTPIPCSYLTATVRGFPLWGECSRFARCPLAGYRRPSSFIHQDRQIQPIYSPHVMQKRHLCCAFGQHNHDKSLLLLFITSDNFGQLSCYICLL